MYSTLIILLFSIVSCNSKPSETDGCLALEKEYSGCKIINFKKTNGQKVELMGAEGYKMEYTAEINCGYNFVEKTDGTIIFEKTEKGWRVMSDGIKPDRREGEACAISGLKMLCSLENIWRQQDCDGNGIRDYWTYDISCFNRMYRADGITKVNLIDISFARADANPAGDNAFNAPPAIEPWSTGTTQLSSASKSGYFFRAMLKDEQGNYKVNPVGTNINTVAAAHNSKFAFVAYSHRFGKTFIVNQDGKVYSINSGDNKIILEWPSNPVSKGWQLEY